jgi:hypothetical protein
MSEEQGWRDLYDTMKEGRFNMALEPWIRDFQYRNVEPHCKVVIGNIFAFMNHVARQASGYRWPLEDNNYLISRHLLPEQRVIFDTESESQLRKCVGRLSNESTIPFPDELLTSSTKSLTYDHIEGIGLARARDIAAYLDTDGFNLAMITLNAKQTCYREF